MLLGSVIVALLGGEFAVRQMAPQKVYRFPQGMFAPHPSRRYTLTPHFRGSVNTREYTTQVRVNAAGLRENTAYGAKTADTYRILALGDSFTMGVGVELEHTYVKHLERLLNAERSDWTYEVINAGVPGYNTRQELAYLKEEGLQLEPDLILLNFYIGNDIRQNHYVPSISVIDGYLQKPKRAPSLLPYKIRLFLARKSHLYQFVWPYQRRFLDWLLRRSAVNITKEYQAQHRMIYTVAEHENIRAMWETTRAQLQTLVTLTEQRAPQLAVVVIPEQIQLAPQTWAQAVQQLGEDEDVYRLDHPNQRLVDLCAQLGLPVLNLLPIFNRTARGAPFYLKLDGHWNGQGDALAAQAVHTFLRDHKLIAGQEQL